MFQLASASLIAKPKVLHWFRYEERDLQWQSDVVQEQTSAMHFLNRERRDI